MVKAVMAVAKRGLQSLKRLQLRKKSAQVLALLLAFMMVAGLLAGCGTTLEDNSSSSEASGSSSQPSDPSTGPSTPQVQPLPQGEPMDKEGPQQIVRQFMDSLINHDDATLAQVLNMSLDNKPYAAWLGVEFKEITAHTLWEEEESGRYELHFRVGGSEDTVFPRNSDVTLILGVGYGDYGDYGVTALYDEDEFFYEKNPDDETQPGYAAYRFVSNYLHLMNTALFDNTQQLSDKEIADYGLICCASEYEDKSIFTQEDLAKMVELHLGIPDFDGTNTPYYNQEEGYYEVWGRGGLTRNMRTTDAAFVGNTATVSVTFYGDLLCLYPVEWVEYTLRQNSDNSFQLVSGMRVAQQTQE